MRTLSNRLKQAEQAATMKAKRGPYNMGMLYERMKSQPETLPRLFQQILREMTTAELLELRGYYVEQGFDLKDVPTEILLKARDSKQPDKVLSDWIGSQKELSEVNK